MRLYEKATPVFDETDLALHLSEPNFTVWQRIWRWIRLCGLVSLTVLDKILGVP